MPQMYIEQMKTKISNKKNQYIAYHTQHFAPSNFRTAFAPSFNTHKKSHFAPLRIGGESSFTID